jgi:integrase/recombinase XerD
MPTAKTLTEREFKQLMRYVLGYRHSLRNQTMIECTHWAGMRVGEVAALRYCDVIDAEGAVLTEVRLAAEQTKGKYGRTVYLPERLRKSLATYIAAFPPRIPTAPLFYTQKRMGFDANTLCQLFWEMYKKAGLVGGSSHSGRKSFLTNLANKGVSIHILQNLAGHRSIAVTAKYLTANDGMLRRAVELI